jgi:hypothetical protein
VPGYRYKHYKILCTGGTGVKYHKESIATYCESASREKNENVEKVRDSILLPSV